MIDRRQFLIGSLAGAAVAACDRARPATTTAVPVPPPPTPRSILILGGTGFLGPHVVEAARARGHTLTLFNRGKTHAELFPELEKLHGDRDGHLEELVGRKWDAVVDTSGYVPRIVKASAELLAPNVGHYVFISTISVYEKEDQVDHDETAALATAPDPTTEDVPQFYGALKALCEQAAEAAMPGRVTTIRPGLIVGPLDPTGRFTHWVTRAAAGGEIIGPGDGTSRTQWIDVRDLAEFVVKTIEDRTTGIFNALGPVGGAPMKTVVDACNHAGGDRATVTWIDEAFLAEHKVEPWQDLPLWVPNEGDYAGFGRMSVARGVAAGLTFRPIATTADATLAWINAQPADAPARLRSSGITVEREAEVLAAWKARGAR